MSENAETKRTVEQFDETEAVVAKIEAKYRGIKFDFTKKGTLPEAKEVRSTLRSLRTQLEKLREEKKKPVLEEGRFIDGEAKRITTRITVLESDFDIQITAEEQRIQEARKAKEAEERALVLRIQTTVDRLRNIPLQVFDLSAERVQQALEEVQTMVIDNQFGDQKDYVELVREDTIGTLERLVKSKRRAEAEAEALRQQNANLNQQVASMKVAAPTIQVGQMNMPGLFASVGAFAQTAEPILANTAPITGVPALRVIPCSDIPFDVTPEPLGDDSVKGREELVQEIIGSLNSLSLEQLQATSAYITTLQQEQARKVA